MTKLHLGCGQSYLKGYVNIDFPLTEHSTQAVSVADELADILAIQYSAGSISEIRLHHVFEHFPRTQASALVAAWNSWLAEGGVLRIEVPDLERTARAVLSPFSTRRRRLVAERHLFGSHEAHWANHYEGYSTSLLSYMLETFGFQMRVVKRGSWKGTYNIDVTAVKVEQIGSEQDLDRRLQQYLENFLLNENPDELKLLSIWLSDARAQWEKSRALPSA